MSTSSPRGTRNLWRVVAQREITTRVWEKSFLITTVLSFVIILGGIIGADFFQGRDQDRTVAVVDPAAAEVVDAASAVATNLDDRVTIKADRVDDAKAAERLVEDGTPTRRSWRPATATRSWATATSTPPSPRPSTSPCPPRRWRATPPPRRST